MAYFDWHEQPGYYRDVTRHFRPETKLLDVGCGTGWLAEHFSDYTGIDGSPEAVAAAQAKQRPVVQGDVDQRLPFDDASFEGVILKDVLEHVADPVAVVRDVRRVLQPGGIVFASSPDAQRWVWDDYTHRRPFTRKGYRLLFADQGFTVDTVGYESVMPGTSIVSRRTRSKRRPAPLRAAAWLPIVRRNVWLLARRPA
jgi:2-polyprenyl-3-methyl-5-hydroxy-6-metoxy-1,4-benzoquinol methylase